ncbi:MAG: DUF4230 domain-containing protein [Saprospiraceae bacterium]|nr:DUF4230 domain-containing protein [Saprospiraceae bacterium]
MTKRALTLFGFLAAFGLGIWLTQFFYQSKQKEITESQSTILLDKVKDVLKLVTVEANFNELYNETQTRPVTLYLPLPSTFSFSKKAILEVQGKVLVGYDLEKVKITADSVNRVLTLSNLPEPEILSIDHQVQYRNLEESFFNSFSAEDYTDLNRNAKDMLKEKVEESDLMDKARAQGNQMLDVIRFMGESLGWTVKLEVDLIESTPPLAE